MHGQIDRIAVQRRQAVAQLEGLRLRLPTSRGSVRGVDRLRHLEVVPAAIRAGGGKEGNENEAGQQDEVGNQPILLTRHEILHGDALRHRDS